MRARLSSRGKHLCDECSSSSGLFAGQTTQSAFEPPSGLTCYGGPRSSTHGMESLCCILSMGSTSLVNQPVFPDCACARGRGRGKGEKNGLAKLDRFSWNKLSHIKISV